MAVILQLVYYGKISFAVTLPGTNIVKLILQYTVYW